MVEAGLAAAVVPDLLVREGHAALTPCPLPDIPQRRSISSIYRVGAHRRPTVTACREALVEQLT